MQCNDYKEQLFDLITGDAGPEVQAHFTSCKECAAELESMRKTMALLDEWQAPEPSPYFDTRFQARLREEMARPAVGRLHWLWRPAWAMSLAAMLVAAAIVIGGKSYSTSYIDKTEAISTKPPELSVPVRPGTAVGDLQALERNNELYADFDVLDELQVQEDVTANP